MKKNLHYALIIIGHVVIIFIILYQKNLIVQVGYIKQEVEMQCTDEKAEQMRLEHELQLLKNPERIYALATKKLHMVPITLKQIKRMPCDEE